MSTSQYGPNQPYGDKPRQDKPYTPQPYGQQPYGQPPYEQQPVQYPSYMHPMPRRASGISALFSPKLVLAGIGICLLLIFIGMVGSLFVDYGDNTWKILMALKDVGAAGGFVVSFGGAFFGLEFSKEQHLGLFLAAVAFMFALA